MQRSRVTQMAQHRLWRIRRKADADKGCKLTFFSATAAAGGRAGTTGLWRFGGMLVSELFTELQPKPAT